MLSFLTEYCKKAINTIAFTDYLEFVLYEKGEETLSAKIADRKDGHIVPTEDEEQISAFTKLISKLIEAKPQPINSARILAETLAAKAKVIAAILSIALSKSGTNQTKEGRCCEPVPFSTNGHAVVSN